MSQMSQAHNEQLNDILDFFNFIWKLRRLSEI